MCSLYDKGLNNDTEYWNALEHRFGISGSGDWVGLGKVGVWIGYSNKNELNLITQRVEIGKKGLLTGKKTLLEQNHFKIGWYSK